MSQLLIWSVNIVLCAIVAGSYIMYGLTFKRVGSPDFQTVSAAASYVFRVLTDPFFMGGLIMALAGSVLRIVLMGWLGITKTALVSELNLVLTVVFSFLVFGEKLRFPDHYVGAGLILLGSYFVSRN